MDDIRYISSPLVEAFLQALPKYIKGRDRKKHIDRMESAVDIFVTEIEELLREQIINAVRDEIKNEIKTELRMEMFVELNAMKDTAPPTRGDTPPAHSSASFDWFEDREIGQQDPHSTDFFRALDRDPPARPAKMLEINDLMYKF